MLAYILALAVGLGSLGIYLAAFFFPEVHRKNDFIWSGVGLFYALVLWVCAGRITGGLLLGQVASVALLSWSVGQTLQLRRQLTPVQQQTELPSAEEVKNTVQQRIANLPRRFPQLGKKQVDGSATTAKERLQQNISNTEQPPKAPDPSQTTTPDAAAVQPTDTSGVDAVSESVSTSEPLTSDTAASQSATTSEDLPQPTLEAATEVSKPVTPAVDSSTTEASPETIPTPPHPPSPEVVEAALQDAAEKAEPAAPPQSTPDSKEESN